MKPSKIVKLASFLTFSRSDFPFKVASANWKNSVAPVSKERTDTNEPRGTLRFRRQPSPSLSPEEVAHPLGEKKSVSERHTVRLTKTFQENLFKFPKADSYSAGVVAGGLSRTSEMRLPLNALFI